MLTGKKIMIIGGTGALGQTLTKHYHENNDILIFSRDEHKHVNMKRDYPKVNYQIGDVKDKNSILKALNEYKPDTVINTAALKHVPVCEDNPYESVKVNILGHENLLECLQVSNHQIDTLMFVSTDKACKPLNVYGMCKAISERLYVDFANKQEDIKVVLCRYGNVLESTGSVIPFFKSCITDGQTTSLPVTDSRMTRFLLSLDESVELIDWAINHKDSHGAIVVPKLKSLNIVDLARTLAKAYSRDDMSINYVGIRPGEKIHEEMISVEESLRVKEFENYFMITDSMLNDETWSYSSENAQMPSSDVEGFLQGKGVIS